MRREPFTSDKAAMLLIDHRVGTMTWTHPHDINHVKKNPLMLGRMTKAVACRCC